VADIGDYNTINPTEFTATQYNGRLDAMLRKDRIGFTLYYVPLSKDTLTATWLRTSSTIIADQ